MTNTVSQRFYGYRIVAAGFVLQGAIVGSFFCYGVFFDALQNQFGWSRTAISAAPSLSWLGMGLMAMIFGRLTDTLEPRRILSIAGLAIAIGYLFMSRVTALWQLYLAYAVFVAIALGAQEVITLSTVARWFGRRRGRMSALVKVGTGSGQIIGPPAAATLITAFGWRSAYLWLAAIIGILVFTAAQFMQRDPTTVGLQHEDDAFNSAPEKAASISGHNDARSLKRTADFRKLCVAQAAIWFCTPIIIVHVVPYAIDLGISRGLAAGVVSVVGAVSIISRITVGNLLDRLGGRTALIGCCVVLLVAFLLLQFANNVVLLYLFGTVYGLGHGGTFTAISPLVAELFGTHAHGELYGTTLFVGTLAGSVGPTVAGGLFDLFGNYRLAFFLLIVLMSVAILSVKSIQPKQQR